MPVQGYRIWHLISGSLFSKALEDIEWAKYERMEAECLCSTILCDGECKGGIYAYRSLQDLVDDNYYDLMYAFYSETGVTVVGQVNLWGTVVEYSQGYRAEYAYPKALYDIRGENPQFASLPDVVADYGITLLPNPFSDVQMRTFHDAFLGLKDGLDEWRHSH